MTISSVSSRGVSVSAPTYSGNITNLYLTVMGTTVNNNSIITCQAILNESVASNDSVSITIKYSNKTRAAVSLEQQG